MIDDLDMSMDEASRIEALVDAYSDLPDGAFWAALEEHGVYPEDIDTAEEYLEQAA